MKKFDLKKYKELELLKIKNQISKDNLNLTILIIQIGNNEESNLYIKNKKKALDFVKINYIHKKFKEDATELEIINEIRKANQNEKITGIIVQLPIENLDTRKIIDEIDPKKDIDGLTRTNQSKLIFNEDTIIPCTVQGIIELFDILKINLEGKNIVILNRSNLIGIPLFFLLTSKNATVRILHSKIKNYNTYTKTADIVITAVGKEKEFITKKDLKKGCIIIDAATIKENNNIYGDVKPNIKKASFQTPVPYGIGQLTILELIKNTIKAYKIQKDHD